MSFLGHSNSITMLFILLFIAGASVSLFHVPSPVMIKTVSGDQIGTGMSFYMVGGVLARTLGPGNFGPNGMRESMGRGR